MTSFLAGFRAQARRLATEPRLLAMVALFAGATWLSVETYARPVVRDLPVAVLDLDGTGLTRTIRRFLEATPELQVVEPPPADEAEAGLALLRGELLGVVVIPDGFTAGVKRGRRAEVLVAVDQSNVLTGKSAARAVQRVLATVSAGAQVSLLEKLGEPPDRALARALPIQAQESLAQNPGASFAVYAAPGFVGFFLHVLALLLAFTALWPRVPGRPVLDTAGRLAAVWCLTLLLGAAATWLLLRGVGIVPASAPHVVLAVLGLFLAADLLFAAALATLGRQGLFPFQVTVLLGMLSLMLSGLTWPWDAIPAPLRAVASAIPFTPFGAASRRLLLEPVALADLSPQLGWLGLEALGCLAVLLAARLVRRLGPAVRRRLAADHRRRRAAAAGSAP